MKKNLVVKQEEISDCGVCSLLSVLRFYKSDTSLEELRIKSNTTSKGVNAYNLIMCAKSIGFDAIGKKLESEETPFLPVIAHLKLENGLYHFVVVYKFDDVLTIMDPSVGFVKMSKEEFKKLSTGIYIELFPKNLIPPTKVQNRVIKTVKDSIIKNRKKILLIYFLNLIFIFLSIVYSFYVELFTGIKTMIIFFGFLLTKNIIELIINNMTYAYLRNSNLALTTDFLKHLFNLPFKYLHIKESGEIVKRIEDTESVLQIINEVIISFILNITMITLTYITLYFKMQCIILLSSLFIILSLILTIVIYKNIDSKIEDTITSETNYKNTLLDYVNGLTSLKNSPNKAKFIDNLSEHYHTSVKKNVVLTKTLNKKNFLKKLLIGLFELIINSILLTYVNKHILSLENFIVINFLLAILIDSTNEVVNLIPNLQIAKKYMRKINEIYALNEEDKNGDIFTNDDIVIKDLAFSYNKFNQVLTNFNLTIKKNDHIVLKGQSGIGKSTLAKILTKEITDYKGSVLIGNKCLNDIALDEIRKHISYSSQNEHIFNGTIKDNIILFENYDSKRLNEVIKITKLNRIIDKRPLKLDTYLSENELSGGEKQLIILARLLYKESEIMILDETLSEVNEELETQIINNILEFYKNRTIIYITHKNSKQYNMKEINMQ